MSYRLWLIDPTVKPRRPGFTGWPFPRSPDSWCKKKVTGSNRCTRVRRQSWVGQVSLLWCFSNPDSFPLLLHIDNVNAASKVSEESNAGKTRLFLASKTASTLPSMTSINHVSPWHKCGCEHTPAMKCLLNSLQHVKFPVVSTD